MTEAALKPAIRYLRWPDATLWRAYLRFLGLFLVFFVAVYIGVGALAVRLGRSMALYAEWETRIPCVPVMVWVYLTLYTIFTLPLLHMTPSQMARLSCQSAATLLVAAVGFLALPGRLGFPPASYPGIEGSILEFLDSLAPMTGRNLVPSLHVAFSALILLGCRDLVSPLLSWCYGIWLLLMCASTVLAHQHHLLDVATGLALAISARRLWPLGRDDASRATRR